MKKILRILPYAKPYWRLALLSALLMVFAALLGVLTPWPIKLLVDYVLGGAAMPATLSRVLVLLHGSRLALGIAIVIGGLVVVFFENAFSVINTYAQTRLEQWMVLDLRGDLFEHAMRLSLGYHDARRSGMLIYAINYQADAAAGVLMIVPQVAQSLLTLVLMFWITWKINSVLALVSLLVVPPLLYAIRYYAKVIQARLRHVKNLEGESLGIIHEAVSMIKVIAAFGREDHEYRRFRDQAEQAVSSRVSLTVRQTLFSLVVNMATALGTALVLGVGTYEALAHNLTVGDLVLVVYYIAAIYKPLETISYTTGQVQDMLVNLQIAFDLLDTEPEIHDAPGAIAAPRARGRVTFDRVDFSYQGRQDTLTDITFDARAGQVIALVGPTGAGKTTIVSLIPRFYQPARGRILLDGTDIRSLTLRSLREQIAVVSQEPLLFAGSIADNIRYGRLDATPEEVMEAARQANAEDFIVRLPEGFETQLGERGAQLSGGERQRVCVARAFLRDAPILILDEPTSAIDSRTEAGILDTLERLMAGRTTFMIAHRLSTVRRADLILVVDRGHIVERGTHPELLAMGGLYRQLHDTQGGDPGTSSAAGLDESAGAERWGLAENPA